MFRIAYKINVSFVHDIFTMNNLVNDDGSIFLTDTSDNTDAIHEICTAFKEYADIELSVVSNNDND